MFRRYTERLVRPGRACWRMSSISNVLTHEHSRTGSGPGTLKARREKKITSEPLYDSLKKGKPLTGMFLTCPAALELNQKTITQRGHLMWRTFCFFFRDTQKKKRLQNECIFLKTLHWYGRLDMTLDVIKTWIRGVNLSAILLNWKNVRRFVFSPNLLNHRYCDWQQENTSNKRRKMLVWTSSSSLDILITKVKSHCRAINHPKWAEKIKDFFYGNVSIRRQKTKDADGGGILSWKTPYGFYTNEELCYALLLVKWREINWIILKS